MQEFFPREKRLGNSMGFIRKPFGKAGNQPDSASDNSRMTAIQQGPAVLTAETSPSGPREATCWLHVLSGKLN